MLHNATLPTLINAMLCLAYPVLGVHRIQVLGMFLFNSLFHWSYVSFTGQNGGALLKCKHCNFIPQQINNDSPQRRPPPCLQLQCHA